MSSSAQSSVARQRVLIHGSWPRFLFAANVAELRSAGQMRTSAPTWVAMNPASGLETCGPSDRLTGSKTRSHTICKLPGGNCCENLLLQIICCRLVEALCHHHGIALHFDDDGAVFSQQTLLPVR